MINAEDFGKMTIHFSKKILISALILFWACTLLFQSARAANPIIAKFSVERESPQYTYNISVEKYLTVALEGAGFEIAIQKDQKADIELVVHVNGDPLGANYSFTYNSIPNYGGDGTFLYTGAKVEGNLRASAGTLSFEEDFSGEVRPPHTTSSWNENETKAPFHKAWENSNFWIVLGEAIKMLLSKEAHLSYWIGVLTSTKGPDLRIDAKRELYRAGLIAVDNLIPLFSGYLREEAIEVVSQIGKGAVPKLIASLDDSNANIQHGSHEALKTITNQDFGLDAEAWLKWWKNERRSEKSTS